MDVKTIVSLWFMGVDMWVVFLQEAVFNMIKPAPQHHDCNNGNKDAGGAPAHLLQALYFKTRKKQEKKNWNEKSGDFLGQI